MSTSLLTQNPSSFEPPFGAGPMEADPGGSFDLQEKVLFALGRQRWLVIGMIAAGLVVGLVVAAGSPNVFTSRARLRLRAGKIENLSTEEMMGVETEARFSFSMMDEVLLLEVGEIYEKVAKQLGPQRILTPPDPTEHDTELTPAHIRTLHQIQKFLFNRKFLPHCSDQSCESCLYEATIHVQAHTQLLPEKGSNVISIYHTGFSPEMAQAAADAVVKASVEKHREVYNVSEFVGLNRENLAEARQLLEDARMDFETHTAECEVVNIDLETTTLLTSREAQRQDLLKHRAALLRVQAEMGLFRDQLATMSPTIDRVEPAVRQQNPSYARTLERIIELQHRRAMLDADTRIQTIEKDRQAKALMDLIERSEGELEKIDPVIETVPEGVVKLPHPLRADLEQKMLYQQAEEQGLLAMIDNLLASLESTEFRLDTLRNCKPIHDGHQTEINSRETAYRKLSDKNAEVEALALLDVQPEANLRVFENATRPIEKDGPRRAKFVLIGLFAGTALACAIAILIQALDTRIRYPRTVEKVLGLPLLGVVPEVRSLRRLTPRRKVA